MDFVDSLFSFLFFMLMSISLTTAQLECYNTGNFTRNSTYDKNRNLILSSLASNVTGHGRFYSATVGQDPDKVYALGVCREDYSLESCASCVRSATEDILTNCPNQKEALSWGLKQTPCTVRYADHSFLGILELDPSTAGYNVGNITSNLTQFDQTWESLMDRVVNKASKGSSRLKFATGEANLTYFQKIYALMQCTPDLSPTNCDTCLRQSLAYFQSCCHGKQGGYVLRPNCNFRWDLYPFYEIIANAPSPSPPIANSAPPSQFTNTSREKGGIPPLAVVIIVVCTIIFVALVFTCIFLRRRKAQKQIRNKQETTDAVDEIETTDFLQFDFSTIRVATGDFSIANKLGQGGFGAVYKGRLPDGQDIAVKRLCRDSRQEQEFKNEVLLVAKLQHRNLVRLRGFCLEGEEKLLIFEFVPNLSLDNLIFDPTKRFLLDWEKRWKIIWGVARGMLYLHEESRFRIIHRDLKASNILLDADMNPKISDFGMARMFELDQTQDNTSRVVGTFGYMAPEYVSGGHFSVKSDVFSFGVLVLEIISGQRNSGFHNGEEAVDLLTYAWKNWNEGTPLNLIDPILSVGSSSEMMRCIHIGLLCVQANAANRPTMATVVLMLNSFTLSLPVPSEPAFFLRTTPFGHGYSESTMPSTQFQRNVFPFSVNEVSITELEPR